MSLSSLMRDTVTIERNDDRHGDRRGGSKDNWTLVQANVRCRVHDLAPDRVMAFGHEMLKITHKIHFNAAVKLDTTHRLIWTDPDDGATRKLQVQGTKRPKAPSMPYVVYAEEQVT